MNIVCIDVIIVGQLYSIQLADPEVFAVSKVIRSQKLHTFTLGILQHQGLCMTLGVMHSIHVCA